MVEEAEEVAVEEADEEGGQGQDEDSMEPKGDQLEADERKKAWKRGNGRHATDLSKGRRDRETMDAKDTQKDEKACEAQPRIPGRGRWQRDLEGRHTI